VCEECLDRFSLRGLARRTRALPPPTAEELLKHAEKFGPALVNETAAEYGLDVKVKPETWVDKRRRRRR